MVRLPATLRIPAWMQRLRWRAPRLVATPGQVAPRRAAHEHKRPTAHTGEQRKLQFGRTYSASGNELTFVSPPDTFEAGVFDYCVQGNVLSIFVAPTSAAGLACDTCTAAYVLTR